MHRTIPIRNIQLVIRSFSLNGTRRLDKESTLNADSTVLMPSLQSRLRKISIQVACARSIVGYGVLALAFVSNSACADQTSDIGFSRCTHFFAGGAAPVIPSSQWSNARPLCFDSFAVLYSAKSKTPLFVAEKLNRAQLVDAKGETRTNRFYPEARLRYAERAQLDDYQSSYVLEGRTVRFDRGHMAPAGDMPTAQAMAQSFSLANIVPQAPHNNRKTWAGIEKATRKYVMRSEGDVYVITGPVFQWKDAAPKLGLNNVWVPSHLYKLVYDPGTRRAWAHWIENRDNAKIEKPITYDELVRRTGINFMPVFQAY